MVMVVAQQRDINRMVLGLGKCAPRHNVWRVKRMPGENVAVVVLNNNAKNYIGARHECQRIDAV